MRRSASEILRNLERRIARLERRTSSKTAKLSAGDAAKWAQSVALELAKLLPNGTTKHPSLSSRLGGVVAYGKDKENPKYVSLISGVGGKDHDFCWAKVSYYQAGSYRMGHGFTMKPRVITTIQDDQFKDVKEAALAVVIAIKGSHFAKAGRSERQSSTNRMAKRYARSITDAIKILKEKFPQVKESMIAEEVEGMVEGLYENLHETIRDMDEEEYKTDYAEAYPQLVKAGLLGEEQWEHNGSRELRNLKEINMIAEMYDGRDLAEYTADMLQDMI
jgi:hypothetical protein